MNISIRDSAFPVTFLLKPNFGRNWPKGKKCDHPKTREVISSPGWGCAYNKIKIVCNQCGKVLHERPI